MQHFKSFLVLVTLAASMSAMAAQTSTAQSSLTTTTTTATSSPQTFPVYQAPSSPTGVSVNTAISDVPSSPAGTTYSGSTNWVNANTLDAVNMNQNVGTTTTSSNNPLLSTDPQFNVMDVKVTASGGCEVKKNGAVIMTGGFAGSPCQKLYGKGLGQTTSSGSSTLPAEYLPSNLDVSFDAQTLDTRAY